MMSAAYGGIASAFGGQAGQNFGMAQQSQERSDAAWADAASGAGYIAGNLGAGRGQRTPMATSPMQRTPVSFNQPNIPNTGTGPIYRTGG
jgi:hypothetical protein